MRNAAKGAMAPVYLFACLVLGGSAQGIWQNAALQLGGLVIIAWTAIDKGGQPVSAFARRLLLIAMAGIGLVALQSLPLPPSLWAHGARERIAEGYLLLGMPVPWLSISLTPYGSLATLLWVIPPLAMFLAIARSDSYHPGWLAAALLAGTGGGILLGALQAMNAGTASQWYLYPQTNVGRAVGFFANASHMAILLIVTVPFAAAIGAAGRSRNMQRSSALAAILVAITILLVAGVALNGSLAGYLLVAPVIVASGLIVLPRRSKLRAPLAAIAGVGAVGAIAILATLSLGSVLISHNAGTSFQSRSEILATTGKAVGDFMPWGSGLGSFAKVYRLYENPAVVTDEYVVHAHNDYVELALELGVAGVVLLGLFLAWWWQAAWRAWKRSDVDPFPSAGAIASATILLHSLVEFPLRTAAMSACFAMCLALLADRRQPPRKQVGDLRPTRHLVIR